MVKDLDVFYSTLLIYLSYTLTDYQMHCITPWQCLHASTKKNLIATFSAALAYFHDLGFSQNQPLDKLIARLVSDSPTMKYKPSVGSIVECLSHIDQEFDSSFPDYQSSPLAVKLLSDRLNG